MKALTYSPFPFAFIFLISGILVGALVVFDPFITNIIANQLDVQVFNTNILKLYPFEFSTLFFLFLLVVVILKKNVNRLVSNPERSFIFLFLFSLQIPALTTMGKFDLSEFILMGFFVLFLVKHMVRQDNIRVTGLDLINLVFVMFLLLSTINGGVVSLMKTSITMVKFLLLVFLIVNVVRDKENLIFLLKWIVIITIISSIISIGQEIVYLTTGVPIVGIVDKDTLRFMIETTSLGNFLRVPAFLGSYKAFTFYLNVSMVILFNYFIYKRPFNRKKTIILVFTFLLMFTALLLTFSKDGLLSLSIGLILSVIIWRPYLIIHLFLCVLAIIIAISVLAFWDDIRNLVSSELSFGEQRTRIQLAREGISGFAHRHTWVGIGIGGGVRYTGHFFGWSAHNALIQAADEVGAIGLSAYLALLFYTLLTSIKFNIVIREISDIWIARSIFIGFIVTLISIQFHPFFIEKFVWLYMGIVQAYTVIVFNKKQVFQNIVTYDWKS